MRAKSAFDVAMIWLSVIGAMAAAALAGIAALHYTPLDALTGGKGSLHGLGWIFAIPVLTGALASLVFLARRGRRL